MNYADPDEVMDGLTGHSIVEWGRDESCIHIRLDDGRTLICVGVGILEAEDQLVH